MPYQFYIIIGIIFFILLILPFTIQIYIKISDQKAKTISLKVRFKLLNEYIKEYKFNTFLNIENFIKSIHFTERLAEKFEASIQNQVHISADMKSFKVQIKILKMVVRLIIIKKFEWKSIIGLDDAMYTAIGAGSLWALKGMLISILSSVSQLETVFLNVQPDYRHFKLGSELCCILKIRIVHIIFITLYAFGLNVRGYWNGITRKAEPSN